jgi:hypothetical protein
MNCDRVLAQHSKTNWGFTDEALNDLIKYRMGRDAGGND